MTRIAFFGRSLYSVEHEGGLCMEFVIDKVFILEVEEPGDHILSPQGVVIVLSNQRFTVYSTGANHNLFRTVLQRTPWPILEQGTRYQNYSFRATDITHTIHERGLKKASDSQSILYNLYEGNQRQFYFLKRYMTNASQGTH